MERIITIPLHRLPSALSSYSTAASDYDEEPDPIPSLVLIFI